MLLVLKHHKYKLVRSVAVEPAEVDEPFPEVAVAVLDNCDPNYKGDGPHGDGVRLLSRNGEELAAIKGLNTCETIGASHKVAIDAKRGRIYVVQLVNRRVTAFDLSGKTLFEVDDFDACSLAVDPMTGNIWCPMGSTLGQGDTPVVYAQLFTVFLGSGGFTCCSGPKARQAIAKSVMRRIPIQRD